MLSTFPVEKKNGRMVEVGMTHLLVVPLVNLDLIPVGDVRVQWAGVAAGRRMFGGNFLSFPNILLFRFDACLLHLDILLAWTYGAGELRACTFRKRVLGLASQFTR